MKEHIKDKLKLAGVPDIYIRDDYLKLPHINDLRSIIEEYSTSFENRNLVLPGSPGTGKTEIMVFTLALVIAICYHKYQNHYRLSFRFFSFTDLYDRWLQENRTGVPGQLLSQINECTLLAIDDFGNGDNADGFTRFISSLISKRYEKNLPTMLTTNLDGISLRKIFGDHVYSRLLKENTLVIRKVEADYRVVNTKIIDINN